MYNETIAQKIIEYIKDNHVSTTEVGDCLQKTGAVIGSFPLTKGHFSVGKVHYIYTHSNTNWPLHKQLINVPQNRIIFIDLMNIDNRALFGELVAVFMFDKLKAAAVVTKGLVRDAAELISGNFPIWCGGITPEGCFNIDRDETPEISMQAKRNYEYYHNSIAVCDDCGVVIIPKDQINDEMYNKLVAIEAQEKIWFHCIKKLNWNTYDTVCLKKYLKTEAYQDEKK